MINWDSLPEILYYYVLPILVAFAYWLYLKKYQFYEVSQPFEESNITQKVPRGKCPPPYPNGWFRICRSNQLRVGQVSEIKMNGRTIAYFRGEDKHVYAVSAYCPHMGANLGAGGKVKFGNCIECPFHGWTFDGKTGKCVNSEAMDPKQVGYYNYCDIDNLDKNSEGKFIVKNGEGEASVEKYHVRELNGFIFVWLHFKEKSPTYEPVEFPLRGLSMRAESVNYVHCHIQEVPENGADMRHFDFLHYNIADWLVPFVQLKWEMKSHRPTEPDFYEKIKHPRKRIAQYQEKLLNLYLSDKERMKYYNVLQLEAYINILGKWKVYAFSVLGFQTGPATVTLFLKAPFLQAIFSQGIQPLDKYYQKVIHTLHISSWTPYWLSTYILYGEFRQVCMDGNIWKKKIFSEKLCYNMKTLADQTVYSWRNWYSQFFEGSAEFEKDQNKLDW